MANNSIFQRNAHRANLQRNAFDLSFSSKFTASVGMLLPCFCKEVNPNEHFRINPQMFLRTVPMNSAAFVRLKQYCEFYFVPYRLLWRGFGQFISGTSNLFSVSIPDGSKFASVPHYTFRQILDFLRSNPNAKDSCGYPFRDGAVRILDLLGYGINTVNVDSLISQMDSNEDSFKFSVSPFRLLAYQKIYSDYYRNADYEPIKTYTFNVDSAVPNVSAMNYEGLWLRYRDWKKDYFNVVKPSFQGSNFIGSTGVGDFDPIVFPTDSRYNSLKPSTDGTNNSKQGELYVASPGTGLNFTVANLRSAFALDKLYRLMVSAKDGSYSEQMKVRFGIASPDDDWKSQFIGAIDAPISIAEVETTADTYDGNENGSAAGTLYGKGSSLSTGNIDFTAKEHGIIMGIFSILPECDYASNMIDPFNVKLQRSDFFQPEFADLGKQPTPLYQFMFDKDTDMSKVLGYNLRYAEYKTSVDSVHGVFNGSSSVDKSNQSYNAWVAPRNTPLAQYSNGATVSFFKALPSVLNSVMVQQYDGTETSDQFLVNANFSVQAIRPMSIYGEPSLN